MSSLSLDSLGLSEDENRAYPRWYTDLLMRRGGESVAVGDVLRFVGNFGLKDNEKALLLASFGRQLVTVEPVEFYAFLRLVSHFLQGTSPSQELVLLQAPVPRPRSILSKKRKNGLSSPPSETELGATSNPFRQVAEPRKLDLDSFKTFIMTGGLPQGMDSDSLKNGKRKKVTFNSDPPAVAEAAALSLDELRKQQASSSAAPPPMLLRPNLTGPHNAPFVPVSNPALSSFQSPFVSEPQPPTPPASAPPPPPPRSRKEPRQLLDPNPQSLHTIASPHYSTDQSNLAIPQSSSDGPIPSHPFGLLRPNNSGPAALQAPNPIESARPPFVPVPPSRPSQLDALIPPLQPTKTGEAFRAQGPSPSFLSFSELLARNQQPSLDTSNPNNNNSNNNIPGPPPPPRIRHASSMGSTEPSFIQNSLSPSTNALRPPPPPSRRSFSDSNSLAYSTTHGPAVQSMPNPDVTQLQSQVDHLSLENRSYHY